MALSRDELKKVKPQTKTISIPDLNPDGDHDIVLRLLNALEMRECLALAEKESMDDYDFMMAICHKVIAEPDTLEPAFADGDIEAVGRLPLPVLRRIFEEGMAFNGINQESLEDVEKNSETIGAASSGSP